MTSLTILFFFIITYWTAIAATRNIRDIIPLENVFLLYLGQDFLF